MVIATNGCCFLYGKLDCFAAQRVEFDGTDLGTLRVSYFCVSISQYPNLSEPARRITPMSRSFLISLDTVRDDGWCYDSQSYSQ